MLGIGPSYTSKVPPLKREAHGADRSAQFTNFLFVELALGHPATPEADLVLRYRSGVLRLINDVGEASTTFMIGIAYRF